MAVLEKLLKIKLKNLQRAVIREGGVPVLFVRTLSQRNIVHTLSYEITVE